MTKKEKDALHSRKCNVEAVTANVGRGPEKRNIVSMSLTDNELFALRSCLATHVYQEL